MLTTTIKTKLYTLVGISDEHTDCGCCGRSGLKRTMVLRPTEGTSADDISQHFVFFGTGCGAKALTWAEGEAPAKKMSAEKLLKKSEEAQRWVDAERKIAEREAAERAHPLWAEVVKVEGWIARPEGMTLREYLGGMSPESRAFYDSHRKYASQLRAKIRADLDAELGPLKI